MRKSRKMKYFLDCETMYLYSVPPKFHYLIDEINNTRDDFEINIARAEIVANCKKKLIVSALTQVL